MSGCPPMSSSSRAACKACRNCCSAAEWPGGNRQMCYRTTALDSSCCLPAQVLLERRLADLSSTLVLVSNWMPFCVMAGLLEGSGPTMSAGAARPHSWHESLHASRPRMIYCANGPEPQAAQLAATAAGCIHRSIPSRDPCDKGGSQHQAGAAACLCSHILMLHQAAPFIRV